jgi:hypothetical protein
VGVSMCHTTVSSLPPKSVIRARGRLIIKICRMNGYFYSFILPSPSIFYVIKEKMTVHFSCICTPYCMHCMGCIQKDVLYGQFKGFLRVILTTWSWVCAPSLECKPQVRWNSLYFIAIFSHHSYLSQPCLCLTQHRFLEPKQSFFVT